MLYKAMALAGWMLAGMVAVDGIALAEKPSLDLRHFWRFDADKPGQMPAGFSAVMLGDGPAGDWKVEADPQTPSAPNRLTQSVSCPAAQESACLQLLLVDGMSYEYPDLTLRLRFAPRDAKNGTGGGAAGMVFKAEKDARNFYAAIIDPTVSELRVVRVVNGNITELGRAPVKLKPVPWHTLRVQHNTILSKDFLEISFDGQIVFTHWDTKLGAGFIGLVTTSGAPIWFDNFDAVQLFSQRPLSPPAAY